MRRVLEPELMTDAEQAQAYAEADFAEVNQGFVDRFRSTFPDTDGGSLLDLGCGPADIAIRFVKTMPGLIVTGVDGSEAMINLGRDAVKAAGVDGQVRLLCARLPGLNLRPQSFNGVVSNSLLHHLPKPAVLWEEVRRLGRPGAAVLVMDLHRPDSEERARQIVEQNAATEPDVLKRDFFNSLCAAFTLFEIRDQLRVAGLRAFRCEMVSDRHWAAWGRLPKGAG
ncbi:MAG TPA: class I SAM-dependent methyltransferase [Methylomirabilota bacterium]|nr:class I SAM-dependent methyltransferase [Methylomirabilota bacterium]